MARRVPAPPRSTALVLPAPEDIPVPAALRSAAWFPALAVLPGGRRQVLRGLKVFAADTGLYLYDREPADPRQVDRIDAVWWSPIDYDKTPPPVTDQTARNTGIPIVTDAGTVTITPQAGCGCGNRPLKGWYPEWATVIHAWKP